ncbi:MAG: hypothetical protein WA821_08535 [Anaerolineales bacterium]
MSTLTQRPPTLTPGPSATPSPRPTNTSTPQPQWVTDFAQPILNAIASRTPNFQDDFHDKSGGWQREDWCGITRMKYQDGQLVLTSCGAQRKNIDYPDFVAELDGRFLPGTKGNAEWAIFFRDNGGPAYFFGLHDTAGTVGLWGFGNDFQSFPAAAVPGYGTNHLLLIAKKSEFAFYVNGKPLRYLKDAKCRWGNIWFRTWGNSNAAAYPSIVAFDNFKLWDISDISIP